MLHFYRINLFAISLIKLHLLHLYSSSEITRKRKHVGAGVVSMANAGPNTIGSQCSLTLKPCPFLDGKHTVFGRIYSGMTVIQRMGLVATDSDDKPKSDVKIH